MSVPLISLADVKSILNISVSTYDAALTAAMPWATQRFESYTQRGLARRTIVDEELVNDCAQDRLPLWAFPIASVSAVKLDEIDADLQSIKIDSARGYIYSTNLMYARRVRVSYIGGYEQSGVPIDLQHAYAYVVGIKAAVPNVSTSSGTSAIRSIGLGGGALQVSFDTGNSSISGSYDATGTPPDLRDFAPVLNLYRRYWTLP